MTGYGDEPKRPKGVVNVMFAEIEPNKFFFTEQFPGRASSEAGK